MFVDGYGILYFCCFGVVSYFGLLVDVLIIGVVKKWFCGKFELFFSELGVLVLLMDKGEQLVWVWCSKVCCNLLFIVIGYWVSVDSVLVWV